MVSTSDSGSSAAAQPRANAVSTDSKRLRACTRGCACPARRGGEVCAPLGRERAHMEMSLGAFRLAGLALCHSDVYLLAVGL